MTKENQIYKCEICGNVVSVLEAGQGELVCCGQPMKLMEEQTSSVEGKEKHVPIIEKVEGGVLVKVGSIEHPMTKEHFINLIQLVKNGKVIIGKKLNFTDKAEAFFACKESEISDLKARIYCNIHGLWIN